MAEVYDTTIHPDLIDQLKEECIKVNDYVTGELSVLQKGKYNTFWLGKNEEPRSFIEYLVRNIALRDYPNGFPDTFAGFEWWTQVRGTKEDITFHYDKDEALCSEKDIYVFPLNGTITYLTDIGGPTAIFKDKDNTQGYLCFPKINKHIVFQGNLFHGVIGPLAKTAPSNKEKRITFLINYWHQKPLEPNCIRFPLEMCPLSPISKNLIKKQSQVQYEKSKIVQMDYNQGTQDITIYRMTTPIPILFSKNLKGKTTYSFSFQRNNGNNGSTVNQAIQLAQNGNYQSALHLFDEILQNNKTTDNLVNKGVTLLRMNNYEQAWDIFREASFISVTKKEKSLVNSNIVDLEKNLSPKYLRKFYINDLKYYNDMNHIQNYEESLLKLNNLPLK
tara:strand:+ start:664 stop:1830 length:1167 start_codon:yes stop_codon:yes gene_type:complete